MPPLHSADPLLILATILLVGMTLAGLAQRIHLPGVTGQILAGLLLGSSGLALFEEDAIRGLQPLTHFALALIGVTVGAHLNLRRLRNAGKRLFLLLLAEATITPILVGLALMLLAGAPGTLAVLLGTLAISTAPATILAVVRETRSRGIFVKTLVAAVALNNMTCIVLFEVARTTAHWIMLPGEHFAPFLDDQIAGAFLEAGSRLMLAVCVGAAMALGAHWLILRVIHPDRLATIWMISILLTFGLASYAELSPLLACMTLGVVHTNLNPARDRLADSVFSNFEPAIMCVFFTLAGLHLSFEHIGQVGLLAGVFFLFRIAGKLLSADLAMRLAGATERVRRGLGMALVPQAGVAIALVILVQDDVVFASIQPLFVTVVLTAVTLSEIFGPILTRLALVRAGEVGRDRPHLVDFLQEENIVTDLEAQTMEQAIEELTDLLIGSHHLFDVERDALLSSAIERERQVSTCLGGGLAVPHGELPEGLPMVGVMGISRRGLHFDTPDGLPLHCVVLLATPRGERDRHLAVLAALARTIGADPALQQQLYNAKSPAHVYEILHGEQGEDFNYFLGDPQESQSDPGDRE